MTPTQSLGAHRWGRGAPNSPERDGVWPPVWFLLTLKTNSPVFKELGRFLCEFKPSSLGFPVQAVRYPAEIWSITQITVSPPPTSSLRTRGRPPAYEQAQSQTTKPQPAAPPTHALHSRLPLAISTTRHSAGAADEWGLWWAWPRAGRRGAPAPVHWSAWRGVEPLLFRSPLRCDELKPLVPSAEAGPCVRGSGSARSGQHHGERSAGGRAGGPLGRTRGLHGDLGWEGTVPRAREAAVGVVNRAKAGVWAGSWPGAVSAGSAGKA